MRIVVAMGVTVIIVGHFLMVAFVPILVCVLFVVVVMPFLIVGMLVMFIMLMLVMFIVGMLVMFVMLMLVMLIVCVRLEQGTFPEIEQDGDIRLEERRDRRIASQVLQRVGHPGCQVFAHPKHEIGILKRGCL